MPNVKHVVITLVTFPFRPLVLSCNKILMKFARSRLWRESREKMPRELSVLLLADICCDFCFSRDGTPFTRELTAMGTRMREKGRAFNENAKGVIV